MSSDFTGEPAPSHGHVQNEASARCFDYFYGFVVGDANQWQPSAVAREPE
jgi:hypothetical protein